MLIVGLGNPGSQYERTRHNIGFMVIDELISRLNAQKNSSSSSFKGEVFKFQKNKPVDNESFLKSFFSFKKNTNNAQNHFLLKPLTYMNLSGESIVAVKNFYKIDKVVVIHDDLDLPFGALRFKLGGGHGGHNGLKSADAHISKEYIRVRMGIGRPEHKSQVASFVLSEFYEYEKKYLKEWIARACDAIEFLIDNSMEETSSKYSLKKLVIQ